MKFMKSFLAVLLFLFLTAAGTVHAQNAAVFRVTNVKLDLTGLPDNCKGLRIAYVASIGLNAGNITEAPYKFIPSELNKLNADIILFGADIFDSSIAQYLNFVKPNFQKWVKSIKQPPMGIYAVCGNSEKFTGLRQLLTYAGIKVPASGAFSTLKSKNGKILYLFTTATRTPEKTQEKALRQVDLQQPSIVLSQFPDVYDILHNDRIALVLSSRPDANSAFSDESGFSNMMSNDSKWDIGSYKDGKKNMYITCGFENTDKNPAEIVLITLQ